VGLNEWQQAANAPVCLHRQAEGKEHTVICGTRGTVMGFAIDAFLTCRATKNTRGAAEQGGGAVSERGVDVQDHSGSN